MGGGEGVDEGWGDVLVGTRGDVVEDCGAHWEDVVEVGEEAFQGGFAIVRVYVEGRVHSYCKPLFGCVDCFAGLVASRVSYHLELMSLLTKVNKL